MSAHTKGPWTRDWKFILAADRRIIAEAFLLPEPVLPQEANARLIAAAPELLAALESIATKAEELAEDRHRSDRGFWIACAEEARAAIAKAVSPIVAAN